MNNKQPSATRELSMEKVLSEEGEAKLIPAASRRSGVQQPRAQDQEMLTHSCQCCSPKCGCMECLVRIVFIVKKQRGIPKIFVSVHGE